MRSPSTVTPRKTIAISSVVPSPQLTGRGVVVVHLEHHARALREQHADALGRLSRLVAGRPAGEPAGRGEAGPAEARVARPGIGAIELFRGGRRIHIRENMMDEFPIAR